MSPAQLSRLTRKDQGVISRILSGERNPSNETLESIARALKLPTEEVFRVAGVLPPKPDSDPWVEEMDHLLSEIKEEDREMVRKLLRTYADKEADDKLLKKFKTKPVRR